MAGQKNFSNDEMEFAPLAEINVTPFIDVMLVLLIIFMITAPLLAKGMKVDLPSASTAQKLENERPIVIAIGPEGEVEVAGEPVAKENLVSAIRAKLKEKERLLQIRGDKAASYGNVIAILDLLAADGLTKFGLVTRQVRESPPEKP